MLNAIYTLMPRVGDGVGKITAHSAFQCRWTGSDKANLSPK